MNHGKPYFVELLNKKNYSFLKPVLIVMINRI